MNYSWSMSGADRWAVLIYLMKTIIINESNIWVWRYTVCTKYVGFVFSEIWATIFSSTGTSSSLATYLVLLLLVVSSCLVLLVVLKWKSIILARSSLKQVYYQSRNATLIIFDSPDWTLRIISINYFSMRNY
jgi:hypothetical protein